MTAQEKFSGLVALMRRHDDIAVAFSGGAKSALLVCAAQEAHGNRIWVLTANTPFFTKEELYRVHEVLDEYKVNNERVALPELLDVPGIQCADSCCAACGDSLIKRMTNVARGVGASVLFAGQTAGEPEGGCPFCGGETEVEMVSPFIELGYTRRDVKEMLRSIGRGYYIKPENDCLARRFLCEGAVSAATLDFIENAEKYIRRYTRSDMKVYIDGKKAVVHSVDTLAKEEQQDVERKLLRNGTTLGLTEIEFLEMRHLEEYN